MKHLHVRTPLDVVAIVPIVLGFVPTNSVVILVTEAEGGKPSIRVDMPATLDDCDIIAGQIFPVFEREGVSRGLLLFYTEDSSQVSAFADRLLDLFDDVYFTDVMHVTPTHYRSLRCADLECCPTGGNPYDLTTHPEIAEAVLEGRLVLQSTDDIARSLIGSVTAEVSTSYREHVKLARDEIQRLSEMHHAHDRLAAKRFFKGEALWVQATLRRCRQAGEMLTDAEVGRMAGALVPLDVRDVAWAQISVETADFYKEFFRNLAQRVPTETAAAPACLFGFASWIVGDGISARIGLERAQEVEPGYGMAGLLLQALTMGMNPERWQPVDESCLPVWDVA